MAAPPARFTATTRLQDCALAFALPVLDDTSFFQALDHGQSSDFLTDQFGLGPRSLWRGAREQRLRDYHTLIARARDLFGFCRASGVEVVEQATLEDLRRLFDTRSVVTLVAHWRGSEFRGPDVLVAPDVFLSRVENGADVIARTLREALTPAWRQKLAATDNPDDGRQLVADFLNAALRALAAPLASDQADPAPWLVRVHDPTGLEAENRTWIEAWKPGWFQRGNRVELLDGLHDVADIDAIVPRHYKGIFDLTVCRSVVLGEALKRTRPQMLILRHRYPVPVARALSIYKAAMQLVANGWNYAQAMVDIHHGLLTRAP